MNWDAVLRVLIVTLVCLCTLVAAGVYWSIVSAQALRFGQKLPSGPPRYYLRDGSPQFICAPYLQPGETTPSWSCAAQADVIAMILKTPPDCGPEK